MDIRCDCVKKVYQRNVNRKKGELFRGYALMLVKYFYTGSCFLWRHRCVTPLYTKPIWHVINLLQCYFFREKLGTFFIKEYSGKSYSGSSNPIRNYILKATATLKMCSTKSMPVHTGSNAEFIQ